jgi:hypothetical protein
MRQSRDTTILQIVPALITLCLISLPAWAKYSGGTGEPNNPYQIATAADLIALGNEPNDYGKCFILTADIDLDPNLPGGKIFDKAVIAPAKRLLNTRWEQFSGVAFSGVFDGHGRRLLHLTIKGTECLGLFGRTSNAEVKNLGVVDVNIVGSGDNVGGLVGLNDGSIANSYSTGSVSGMNCVGGLVGRHDDHGYVTWSCSSSSVNGTTYVGGLVGSGLGRIATSHSSSVVNGTDYVGGLVGLGRNVIAGFSSGAVNGIGRFVGGLVGENSGCVAVSYNSSKVGGTSFVGGLVGQNAGYVAMTYSTGAVKGDHFVGGLVGYNWVTYSSSVIVTSSFWDIQTSGQTTSDGGQGKTTADMQKAQTFLDAGWDLVGEALNGTCDYWQIAPGDYPMLRTDASDHLIPEGLGTAERPYLIRDARDLGTVWLEPKAHYRLAQSIDLSGMRWSLSVIPWFGGLFDGNDCVIRHLHIQGFGYLGFFGELTETASVSKLGLEAVDVNGTGEYIGALVGTNRGGSISGSYSTGLVCGAIDSVGGLVGANYEGNIHSCFGGASVRGNNSTGGLVGYNESGKIAMSYSTGAVSGGYRVGGLVGYNDIGTISSSQSTGAVSGTGRFVGGLVGLNDYYSSITSSYSNGAVSGTSCVGGLVGNVNYSCNVTTSYSSGAVRGTGDYVGGLVGIIGRESTITSSFWDADASGQAQSAGGTGKTTAQMQKAKTFLDVGWDFVGETKNGTEDIWWIDEGKDYPRLWWE